MTCKDCIHYNICLDNGDDAAKQNAPNAEKECDDFKNKADFVEVVRCEKCKRRVDYEGKIMCNKFGHKFQGEWYGLKATTKDHFCSCGERRDT